MRTNNLGLIPAILYTAAAIAATGDQAKQLFQSVYGARLRQVTSSVDRADDLALAKAFVEAARENTDTPELAALLCEHAYDLGSKHPDGYATATDAMTLLAEKIPGRRAAAMEKLIDVLTRQTRAGKPEERDAAGEKIIEILTAQAQSELDAGKYSEATALLRRAQSVAAGKKSPSTELVKAMLEDAMRRDRARKQIDCLQELLLKDATDHAAAEEIVKLYLLELDDAAAAGSFLNRVKDANLKAVVPLAAQPLASISKQDAMALGTAYRQFATDAKPQDRELWVKAQSYLSRFLELHPEPDVNRTRASVMFTEAQEKLKAMEKTAPVLVPRTPRDPLISTDKHNGFTGFQRQDNEYKLESPAPIIASRTRLSYKAAGDSSTNSAGDIFVRMNDRDWVKVGTWTQQSITAAAPRDNWHDLPLTALPRNASATKLEVRFQYTAGDSRLNISEVKWLAK